MALTIETNIDKIEVVGEFKFVQVREAKVVLDGGAEIARTCRRYVISPLDTTANQHADVIAVCGAVHTPEIIAAYQAHIASQ